MKLKTKIGEGKEGDGERGRVSKGVGEEREGGKEDEGAGSRERGSWTAEGFSLVDRLRKRRAARVGLSILYPSVPSQDVPPQRNLPDFISQ